MLATVTKLLPLWVLEGKAQDLSHSPLQAVLCFPSSQEYLCPLQLVSFSPQILGEGVGEIVGEMGRESAEKNLLSICLQNVV